jgi:hypothetical protein
MALVKGIDGFARQTPLTTGTSFMENLGIGKNIQCHSLRSK